MEKSFELSNKKYKNGRRRFKAVLYKLQPPECVINETGTKYNKNGLTFLEEYCEKQLDSIKDMSVTVSFLDSERTMISDHGFTEMHEDGLPVFDDATEVGHFTRGYIDDVEIDGETVRCVCGEGIIDEMRYHGFVENLESSLADGLSIDGSIEIYRDENHDSIVYKFGYKDLGRIPTDFVHSGWSMVLSPADTNSKLIELNNKETKQEVKMDEKELKTLIVNTINETNSAKVDVDAKIAEMNEKIEAKDAEIAKLNEAKEAEANACADKDKEIAELNEKIADLQKKLDEAKKAEMNSALDKAIENFTEEEKKFAESEINSFHENPLEGNVDTVVSKIYASIGQASKKAAEDARVAEQNSMSENDIFMAMEEEKPDADDENIF